jgi:hypothetical protein
VTFAVNIGAHCNVRYNLCKSRMYCPIGTTNKELCLPLNAAVPHEFTGREQPMSIAMTQEQVKEPGDTPSAPPAYAPPAGAIPLAQIESLPRRDAQAFRLEAALLDGARALQSLHQRLRPPSSAQRDMLERCDALLSRALCAARERRPYVAWDCLQQIERERVPALTDDERGAELTLMLAESRSRLGGWRHQAAEALATSARGEAPSSALLQAVMRTVHTARQEQRYRVAIVRQQLPALALMLVTAVVFFALWALLGGFDWLARDDVQVTVGMVLVSGVLMGFFGGLLSFAFSWLRATLPARIADPQAQRWMGFARPVIGAAVAVPIVLFTESGLINLGQLSPALVLALCFCGGFSERWFVAHIERVAGDSRD